MGIKYVVIKGYSMAEKSLVCNSFDSYDDAIEYKEALKSEGGEYSVCAVPCNDKGKCVWNMSESAMEEFEAEWGLTPYDPIG